MDLDGWNFPICGFHMVCIIGSQYWTRRRERSVFEKRNRFSRLFFLGLCHVEFSLIPLYFFLLRHALCVSLIFLSNERMRYFNESTLLISSPYLYMCAVLLANNRDHQMELSNQIDHTI